MAAFIKPMLHEKIKFHEALIESCQNTPTLSTTLNCQCYASEMEKLFTWEEFILFAELAATVPEEEFSNALIKKLGLEQAIVLSSKISAIEETIERTCKK